MTKTPEQMAEEYAEFGLQGVPDSIRKQQLMAKDRMAFLAGYQAAKDEEVTKDQKIAALWTESIKNMLPSVHEVVLFPSESTRARDAEVVAKMDAAIKKAKDPLADSDKVMPQWISIKDRLPEQDVAVLTYGQVLNNPPEVLGVRRRYNGDQEWKHTWESEDGFIYREDDITHWMPLPKPPEKAHD